MKKAADRTEIDKLLGKETPKKERTTTGVILDSYDLQTLRTVAHWRVARGNNDRASVSEMIREAVKEYIQNHDLIAEEIAANSNIRPVS